MSIKHFERSPSGFDTKPLHTPAYDFNDDSLPIGAGFWTHLTEAFLA